MRTYASDCASPLGRLTAVCSDEHLLSLTFANENAARANDHSPLLSLCLGQLDDYFAGRRQEFALPLNQRGTAFQQKVWDLLSQIPYGKTLSYHELSRRHGDGKAIRAVATANGKNNLAIVVPCHRVIGADGSLTGYAGGLWRKRWLLEHEAKHSSGLLTLF